MKEIGQKLRERREELGFTLEQMCEKTKVTIPNLKAIEAGDLEYFDNDLSYLRFYIKYYCQALYLDYEPFRALLSDSIDQYTNTVSLNRIQQQQQIEKNVNKRKNKSSGLKKFGGFEKKKIDYSLYSLIAVIVIVVISLIIVLFSYVIPFLTTPSDTVVPDSTAVVPDPIEEPTDTTPTDTTPVDTTPAVLAVTMENPSLYNVTGWTEGQNIMFTVNFPQSSSYMRVSIDDVVTNNPIARKYVMNEKMEILTTATGGRKISIYFGYIKNSLLNVNELAVPFDPSIATSPVSATIVFVFKGA